jgi:hypothetical protein
VDTLFAGGPPEPRDDLDTPRVGRAAEPVASCRLIPPQIRRHAVRERGDKRHGNTIDATGKTTGDATKHRLMVSRTIFL